MKAKFRCLRCRKKFEVDTDLDLIRCPGCRKTTPTGLEGKIRTIQEAYRNSLRWPRAAVGRAIIYAAGIYDLATHGKKLNASEVEAKIHKSNSNHPPATVEDSAAFGRHGAGVDDDSVGLMFVLLKGPKEEQLVGPPRTWRVLYIVFRGSRGEKQGESNPKGAGWGQREDGKTVNTDWRSNFNTVQVVAPWSAACKIHRGFLDIYTSVRAGVHNVVRYVKSMHPHTRVIVTGHSLGAGLATICAHDLEHSGLCHPSCYPFCVPRAGNLGFVRDYNIRIADRTSPMHCEFDKGSYHRSFSFVQSNDPVSWGGKHGFRDQMTEEEAQEVADSGSIGKQLKYALFKKDSDFDIYYHPKNLVRASYRGLHSYEYMEKTILE